MKTFLYAGVNSLQGEVHISKWTYKEQDLELLLHPIQNLN